MLKKKKRQTEWVFAVRHAGQRNMWFFFDLHVCQERILLCYKAWCLSHYKSFLSNLIPPNWATLATQEICHHLMALLPLMLGAGKVQQLRNSSKPLITIWYLNVWRTDFKYFFNVPFSPPFPKVLYFSPVVSWGIWLWYCSRSNISEQHFQGPGAWKVGLGERYL